MSDGMTEEELADNENWLAHYEVNTDPEKYDQEMCVRFNKLITALRSSRAEVERLQKIEKSIKKLLPCISIYDEHGSTLFPEERMDLELEKMKGLLSYPDDGSNDYRVETVNGKERD